MDLGGQWIHGEVDNVAYELAWPLGLVEHSSRAEPIKFFSSSGPTIDDDTANDLFLHYFENLTQTEIPAEYSNSSIGEYYELKLIT